MLDAATIQSLSAFPTPAGLPAATLLGDVAEANNVQGDRVLALLSSLVERAENLEIVWERDTTIAFDQLKSVLAQSEPENRELVLTAMRIAEARLEAEISSVAGSYGRLRKKLAVTIKRAIEMDKSASQRFIKISEKWNEQVERNINKFIDTIAEYKSFLSAIEADDEGLVFLDNPQELEAFIQQKLR